MTMIKEELLQKLADIEWDDFECKAAKDKLPEDVWATVSAFSNTSGGWIVFGIKQVGKRFEIQGLNNGEKTESDFLNTLRNGQKFNMRLTAKGRKYNFDGKLVLAFFVPSSIIKPVYFGNPINTFIRTGSGDRRATETEIMAMMRDQAFGCKSELVVEGTGVANLNKSSLETYRNHVRNDNPSFPYKDLTDDQFCEKVGISKEGRLTIGGILMLGQRDVVQRYINNFWIDYLEIPGKSMTNAQVRYTYRMQEQDNIWESYQIILQRLRNFTDAPYEARPDGVGTENESQLYALREGLTNCCAHADYFSPMHPTIRVFSDRIEMQNPGRFMFPLSELRTQIHSIPRNPNIIKFFRYAKLGENAGYGIDKILSWEQLTKGRVDFSSDLVSSTITFWYGGLVNGTAAGAINGQAMEQPREQAMEQPREQVREQPREQVQRLVNVMKEDTCTFSEILRRLHLTGRRYVLMNFIKPAVDDGYVLRSYPDKPNHPAQRYYLSEKGLKLVKKLIKE